MLPKLVRLQRHAIRWWLVVAAKVRLQRCSATQGHVLYQGHNPPGTPTNVTDVVDAAGTFPG